MSPLLGPILAQLITLGIGDRTEARYISSNDKYLEASTSPRIGLSFGWKHTTLSLGYGPSITVTPLDSKPRDVLIFHAAAIAASYRWQRTTVTLSEAVGYGEVNFQDQALAAGAIPPNTGDKTGATGGTTSPPAGTTTPPGGATGTGAGTTTGTANPTQLRALNRNISYATSTTNLNLTQAVSAVVTVAADVGYFVSGAVGSSDSTQYPTVKGPRAQVSASDRLTRHDAVTSTLSSQYAASSTGNNALFGVLSESWGHVLDTHSATSLGAGLSVARNSQTDGTVAISIYPAFSAGISYGTQLARGTLGLGTGISAAPALDPVRAAVDPRLSFVAFSGWGRDRFSSALSASTALSIADPNARGALSSFSSSLTFGYRLGAGFSVDTGVRGAWQSFEGQTTIPVSWAAFLGIGFGVALPLNGGA